MPAPADEDKDRVVCAPPWHVGPVRTLGHWGKSGRYRARLCEHCGLRWRERLLPFGAGGRRYWRRSILTLEDLDESGGRQRSP